VLAPADPDREFRWAALQAGFWLGWLSIAALLAALLFDRAGQHRLLLLAFIAAAGLANGLMMVVPWRGWLTASQGQVVLDLWSAGLIAFASLLVVLGGARADFELLFFLVLPFLASVQSGWRRPTWVAAAAVAFLLATLLAPSPLAAEAVLVRGLLLAAAVVLALVLGRAIRRQAAAGAEAAAPRSLFRVTFGRCVFELSRGFLALEGGLTAGWSGGRAHIL
jgi:hypothetical protein